jgi:hypothetical protein
LQQLSAMACAFLPANYLFATQATGPVASKGPEAGHKRRKRNKPELQAYAGIPACSPNRTKR